MKFNNKFIIGWWVMLLLIFGSIIISRYKNFISDTLIPFDYILLILLFVLVFLPLYSEMSMFGFSLKKEIESVETSVNDLKNLVVNNTNSNNVYVGSPDPNLNKEQKEQIQKNLGLPSSESENIVDEFILEEKTVINYFAIRYLLEKEIKRIAVSHLNNPNTKSTFNLFKILDNHGVFDPSITNAFLEVWSATTRAIHGEEIRESDKKFVDSVATNLINRMKQIV